MVKGSLLAFLLLLSCSYSATAQRNDDTREIRAHRTNGSITIDGSFDEPAWSKAAESTAFTQYNPNEGETPSFPTVVRVLYGEESVYIGAVMHDDAPDEIVGTLSRRDELNKADRFRVYIDSYLNHQSAYSFAVSAANVQADWIMRDRKLMDGLRRVDTSWDAIWYSAVQITPEGWNAEIEIPYTMLRFPDDRSIRWGINFQREIARLGEVNDWVFIPRSAEEFVANFGVLSGLSDIEPQRNLQVRPYTLSRLTGRPEFAGSRSYTRGFEAGADVKLGISSSITADATINPDFGQVESDPAILNLTTYETFFPEKRPFFLEGVDIFDFSFPNEDGSLLYTRRIGGRASPILGALKLSGRAGHDYSFGVLGAATGQDYSAGRYYGAARMRRHVGRTSYVGGMVTGYRRGASTGTARTTIAAGTDWDLRFANRAYQFTGFAAASDRSTGPGRAETGIGFHGSVGNVTGHFTYAGGVRGYDERFQVNDLGWLRENNFLRAEFIWQELLNNNRPFGPFRRGNIGGSAWRTWQYDSGLSRGYGSFTYTNWRLRNFHLLGMNLRSEQVGGFDVRETRGLGPYENPGAFGFDLEYDSDPRRSYELSHRSGYLFYGNGGSTITAGLEGSWDVSSRVSLSAGISHERDRNVEAWTANEPFLKRDGRWLIGPSNTDPSETGTADYSSFSGSSQLDAILGNETVPDLPRFRYAPIFGRRDTRSLSLNLRGNIVFLPRLSLQIFNQLFAARGRYDSHAVLTAPNRLRPFSAYPKQQDFSIRSYTSNIVLRWEYRPGSTLFVVWSQTRRHDEDHPLLNPLTNSPYDTTTYRQLLDTFDLFPTDIFLIKLNYTFLP